MAKKDFKETEYTKAFETYRTQILTTIQIVTGFVTINATIVGLGINFQKSWLFLLGGIVSLVIVASVRSGERASRVFLMRAVQLEDELGTKDDSISSLWTAYFYGPQRLSKLREIAQIKNIDEKMRSLRHLKTRLDFNKYILLIYFAILGQIVLAILLPVILGWDFF
jgi:hypothetical protein